MFSRRRFLTAAGALWPLSVVAADADAYPRVERGRALRFPRDHGSHPEYRTEWWYLTGWLEAGGAPIGVQITFFRNRPRIAELSRSRFAPGELLFAHAAIADPASGKLVHDQRAARSGFGLAHAGVASTDVAIDDWSLALRGENYRAKIAASGFRLDLEFAPSQAILLQGDQGFSRKGPNPLQSSYYYSRPQLTVSGTIERNGKPLSVSGRAWLDHEWSSEVLSADALGWDWVGLNLDDGGALMAFRIRGADGSTLWAGGSRRDARGAVTNFAPDAVRFEALRRWRSPRSGAEYPVAMRVEAGGLSLDLEPLMDDQELDSRASTGTIYWEGAVRAYNGGEGAVRSTHGGEGAVRSTHGGEGAVRSTAGGKPVGRGYLELTGYWKKLVL